MALRTDSLEFQLKFGFAIVLLLQLVCASFLFLVIKPWQVLVIVGFLIVINSFIFNHFYKKYTSVFRRANIQLDAIQQEDYSLFARSAFSSGSAAELHEKLNQLGEKLQKNKRYYDEQPFLLYRLIDQLNTPIMVFDHKLQLIYANAAFSDLFHQPWQTLRHASPALLGLIAEPEWQFVDVNKSNQWQIRHSRFLDQGQNHQLLVFTNIQMALRESQLEAWQKLIRVLSHEIRNSLTPVSALTQNLQSRLQGEREQQALELIGERCKHLQDFVSRYSELHKPLQVQSQWLKADNIFQRLTALFPEAQLQAKGLHLEILADQVLLQQVLINLIKNAIEAASPAGSIEVVFSLHDQQNEIRILDSGQGIANPDNLFVPFYSTKIQGQGIGLSLSRHIIEQMGGQLSLINNTNHPGACALITLPRPL